MSADEFKPGDVARLLIADEWAVGLAQTPKDERLGPLVWQIGGHSFYKSIAVGNDTLITDVRPLVVLDPEDREQIERFRDIASRWADRVPYTDMREPGDMDHTDAMHAALREFVEPVPAKPNEPQGLGAVVEDADGARWTNTHQMLAWVHQDRGRCHYRDLDVVRVLPEGVQP